MPLTLLSSSMFSEIAKRTELLEANLLQFDDPPSFSGILSSVSTNGTMGGPFTTFSGGGLRVRFSFPSVKKLFMPSYFSMKADAAEDDDCKVQPEIIFRVSCEPEASVMTLNSLVEGLFSWLVG